MIELLYKIAFFLLSKIKAIILILLSFGYLKYNLFSNTLFFPNVRLRNKGVINIGDVKFRDNVSLFSDGGEIIISDGCFLNKNCSINAMDSVFIDKNTIFGEGVIVYDHNHRVNSGAVSKDVFDIDRIHIGKNCWIGSNVIILKGIKICDNVVIGAGTLVTKDILEPGIYISQSSSLRKIK
ncbi:acyltransferase [Vibrio cholerae]|uniref:acyltransferase n=1 Tax=Vibrio cholerae TaxID=666 RepID=UPI00163C7A39|nr:acyltransferase [Vibrio cholerae]